MPTLTFLVSRLWVNLYSLLASLTTAFACSKSQRSPVIESNINKLDDQCLIIELSALIARAIDLTAQSLRLHAGKGRAARSMLRAQYARTAITNELAIRGDITLITSSICKESR